MDSLESVQSLTAKLCTNWTFRSELAFSPYPLLQTKGATLLTYHQTKIYHPTYILPSSHSYQSSYPSFTVSPSAFCQNYLLFFVSSCTLWNSLPSSVTFLHTARSFKAALSPLFPDHMSISAHFVILRCIHVYFISVYSVVSF